MGVVQARLRELEVDRPMVVAAAERAAEELRPLEYRLAVVQQVRRIEQLSWNMVSTCVMGVWVLGWK